MCKIIQGYDKEELKKLLDRFMSTNRKAESIVKKLETEILIENNTCLKTQTLIQFSKWCNTNTPYSGTLKQGGQQIARNISKLIFGKIIGRKKEW